MSKFKIGDIVNVLYDFDKIVKGKVIDFNQATLVYDIEILESNDVFIIGQLYKTHEVYLKKIESKEVKQVLQAKPSNDFIYFKDKSFIIPKKVLKENPITINEVVILNKQQENGFKKGFGVYSSNCQLKGFETREEAQEFIKQLADALGSDIL